MLIEETIHDFHAQCFRPDTNDICPPVLLREGSGNLPFVSVILPTRCEEKYIESCLLSMVSQNYPVYRMEVLVVDGMSEDRTRSIVRRIARDYPQVRLLDNPERQAAQGLNRGIQASRGAYILRLDPRAEYGRGYVKACVDTLLLTGADNVGGPQQTRARTFFQRMVSFALQSPLSPLSSGRACPGKGQPDGYVDSVVPGAFRRQALQRVGLFDPGAVNHEDAEINQRILSTGGKIYLSSAIECYFYPRESMPALAAYSFRHGHGLARTILKHGRFPAVNAALPFLFFLGGAALLLACLCMPGAAWPAGLFAALYALILGSESARLAMKHHGACAPILPLVFATMHLAHATGFAWGLLYYSHNPDWTRITPPLLQQ